MHNSGIHVFDTALGTCGLAWAERGIVGIQLPERDGAATRRRLQRRFPTLENARPDDAAAQAVTAIVAALAGGATDFDAIALDMCEVPAFAQQVYALARAIPRGSTATYGELAVGLGDATLARDVGRALGANPFPIVVPCHRVLAATGLGGFSAHGGAATKRRMLGLEGASGLQFSMFDLS